VRAAESRAALATNGINLIHENDAGRMALGLFKQVAHTAGAHADEHFHKFRTGDGEERNTRLARDGLCEQGLAGAGRANQQDTLGNARPKLDEFLRLFQELDNFLEFLLGLVHTGHIRKRDRGMVAAEHAGAALAEGHGRIIVALCLAENEPQHAHHEEHGHNEGQGT
jgi:hypothetical protein